MSPRKGPKDWSPSGKGPKIKFIVLVKEAWYQKMEVLATSSEEAIRKVADGEGEQVGEPYYKDTMETDEWFSRPKEESLDD